MAKANLVIDQGTDFSKELTVTSDAGSVVDLTGYTASGQIRKHFSSNTATSFTCTFAGDRTTGKVTISLGRNLTETLSYGRYMYDIEITNSSNTRTRLLEGIATITPEVTRTSAFVRS
mgnify:CR=1 FL=1